VGQDTAQTRIDFATGYKHAVWGPEIAQVAAAPRQRRMTLVGEQPCPRGTTPSGAIFQQAYTANPSINATIEAKMASPAR